MNAKLTTGIFLVVSLALSSSCNKTQALSEESAGAEATLPVVTDDRKDLVLSWFADGGSEVASSVSEVPEDSRKEVRVQDPSIPPESRNPGLVFMADLSRAGPGGKYKVRAIPREDFEKIRAAARPKPEDEQLSLPSIDPGAAMQNGPAVIMYATTHCPICHKARRWLLDKKIPYIEKDIERDSAAAGALAAKGKAQGVQTTGVPIFEIYGRLVPGFDPSTIMTMLSGKAAPVSQTI